MTPFVCLACIVAAADPAGPQFVAKSSGAAVAVGPLVRLGPGFACEVGGAAVPAGKLVSLSRADRPRPPFPAGPQLLLANGDRIPGKLAAADDLGVRVAAVLGFGPAGADWRVPVAQIRVLWRTAPPGDAPPDPENTEWVPAGRKSDLLLMRNADVRAGELARFGDDAKTLAWTPAGGAATSLDAAAVAAVAFNPALVSARSAKGPAARLVTANGARVTLTAAAVEGNRFRGTTAFGAKLDIPLADVIALDVIRGPAVYLSDITPAATTAEGYWGPGRPHRNDRSIHGNPLRLAGLAGEDTFDKGLGTAPRTTLTYAAGGKYRRFEAVVGMAADTGRRGTAAARILIDGKPAAVPGLATLAAAAGPVAVSLDVTGAKQITLEIDFGPGGAVQADVNWADARFVE